MFLNKAIELYLKGLEYLVTRPEIKNPIGLTHCPGSPDGLRHQVRAKPLPAEISINRFLASALTLWGLSWALFGGWLSL